jgi:hypothetical protein
MCNNFFYSLYKVDKRNSSLIFPILKRDACNVSYRKFTIFNSISFR